MYKVYMHKSPSGGVYIGITRQSLKRRWRNGSSYKCCKLFYNAIKKYGWDNIRHTLLFDKLSELDAKMIEIDLIHYYKKIGKSYNITDGGEGSLGVAMSKETKQKISMANKGRYIGRKLTDSWKNKVMKNLTHITKPVLQMKDKVVIAEYPSIKDAALAVNRNGSNISFACKNNSKCAGYNWKYKEVSNG